MRELEQRVSVEPGQEGLVVDGTAEKQASSGETGMTKQQAVSEVNLSSLIIGLLWTDL